MENRIQWTRRELKEHSRVVLRAHYWRIILVALLFSLLAGSEKTPLSMVEAMIQEQTGSILQGREASAPFPRFGSAYEMVRDLFLSNQYLGSAVLGMAALAAIVLLGGVIFSGVLVSIFIINPLEVGSLRFYNRGFDAKPRFKELFHVFEYKYKNIVSVMFLRDLYTLFWFLLFIIPGIVKSYEYLIVPYILSEHPDMQAKEAFAASRQLMQGQKWKAFVLDVSFLGWAVLSGLTFGLLGIFFVTPYRQLAFAALYRKLLGGDVIPHNIYYDGMDEDGWYSL